MTVDQFFTELARTIDQGRPSIMLDTAKHLRIEAEGRAHCPVTYLCAKITGQVYDVAGVDNAAEAIGLPYSDAVYIADAADNHEAIYAGLAATRIEQYRRRLIAACGIESSEDEASERARLYRERVAAHNHQVNEARLAAIEGASTD